MPWNSNWPFGNQSVKSNESPGLENTTYIETTMGNDIVGTNANGTQDHFWDVDAGLDGHHRFMKLPGFTVGGLPDDPIFDTNFIKAVYYVKQKLAAESTAQQDFQCFYKNSTNIMQLLGIRAMGVFNGSGATPPQASVVYSHNLALQTAGTPGIFRNATGDYTVTFDSALPSENYLILGGAVRSDSARELLFEVKGTNGAGLAAVKTINFFKFITQSDGGNKVDPLQCWFVCFGG